MKVRWCEQPHGRMVCIDRQGNELGRVTRQDDDCWIWRAGPERGVVMAKEEAMAQVERRVDSGSAHWDVFVSWVALKWSHFGDRDADTCKRLHWVAPIVDTERGARIALGAAAMVGNEEFDRLATEWRSGATASLPTTN